MRPAAVCLFFCKRKGKLRKENTKKKKINAVAKRKLKLATSETGTGGFNSLPLLLTKTFDSLIFDMLRVLCPARERLLKAHFCRQTPALQAKLEKWLQSLSVLHLSMQLPSTHFLTFAQSESLSHIFDPRMSCDVVQMSKKQVIPSPHFPLQQLWS